MAEDLKKIAKEMGIDKPILATKVVGNRLELYLYGGDVVQYSLDAPAINWKSLTVDQLKEIAQEAGIEGYSKMKKAELIEALS